MTSLETVAANQAVKKPTTIKKTVHCDERKVCTTTYSDH
jgi:aspartyl protease family protein